MGEEEGAVVRQIAKERKRKNTEKGETNTEHKYNYIQVHMLVPKTKLHHLSGKGRLTGEQVDAIKRDLQVSFKHLKVSKCTIVVLGILRPIFLVFGLVCLSCLHEIQKLHL